MFLRTKENVLGKALGTLHMRKINVSINNVIIRQMFSEQIWEKML